MSDELVYWGYLTRGTPDGLIDRIATLVRENNLDRFVKRIYCEKPSRRYAQELYLFLAVPPNDGGVPEKLGALLALAGIHSPFEHPFNFQQIKGWTRTGHDLESYNLGRKIAYRISEPVRPDNPFDLLDQPLEGPLAHTAYNYLLSWLSATGEGSWDTFRQVCAELGLNVAVEVRHLFRRLRLLGHVEYLDGGQRWVVAPPCLVQIIMADDDYSCFLAGARTPCLLTQFEDAIESSSPVTGAPDRVQLTFVTRKGAEQFAANVATELELTGPIHVVGPVALHLADALPGLDGWQHQVLRPISVPVERYKIMRWDGQNFDEWVAAPKESGMYQLIDRIADGVTPPHYLFYDAEDGSWRQGDWYGLRYLANVSLGSTAELFYQVAEQKLYVPDSHRLPDLYERALVLASGTLPAPANGGVVFDAIPPHLAILLAGKLQAHLERVV